MNFLDASTCENAVEAFATAEEAFCNSVFTVLVRDTLKTHLFTSKEQTFAFVQECRSKGKNFKLCNCLLQEIPFGALRLE